LWLIRTPGRTTESDMMRWAQDNGSQLSTNSWAFVQSYGYGSAARTVDRAVRDADTSQAGQQPLCVLFAAGNDGAGASTVQNPGTAKNAITVGASHNARCASFPTAGSTAGALINSLASFSGRGPSQGRIKPDLVAVGANVLSVASDDAETFGNSPDSHGWDQAWTGDHYELMPGTSMATPIAAGAAACFFEFYRATFGAFPSPAVAKAALVNGAVDMGGGYQIGAPNQSTTGIFAQGWGRLNLKNSILGPAGGTIRFVDETAVGLRTGQSSAYRIDVRSPGVPLKISLVWTDPEALAGSAAPLVNNLDLVVIAPNGAVFRGNRFTGAFSTPNPGATADSANNVECVFVQSPPVGVWRVEVRSANTAINVAGKLGQDFALAYSGAVEAGDLLTNGGFDTGSLSPWSASGLVVPTTQGEQAGTHCAKMLGDMFGGRTGSLAQAPAFPTTGMPVTLRFFLRIVTSEVQFNVVDKLDVEVTDAAGTRLGLIGRFTHQQASQFAAYREVTLRIPSRLAVSGNRIRFSGTDDGLLPTTFFVDSVSAR
jgi:hypothetical protein